LAAPASAAEASGQALDSPESGCTNLTLAALRQTNGSLELRFLCKEPGVLYDLLCATNLGVRDDGADVFWDTVREVAPAETNWVLSDLSGGQRFYRLVRLLDPAAFPTPALYVSAGAAAAGDGSRDLPFQHLQTALNAATNSSVIQVLPGVYSGVSNRHLSFGAKTLVLVSERGWEQTVLDCGGGTGSRAFEFSASNATPQEILIIGFTVSNAAHSAVYCSGGSRPTFINCCFTGNGSPDGGGALHCTNASPVFLNCRFLTNDAGTQGGAVFARGSNSAPRFSHCTFSDNTRASGGGQVWAGDGACVVLNNSVVWSARPDLGDEVVTNTAGRVLAGYCAIRGAAVYPGIGNLTSDPALETNGSGRLTLASPCIDQGTTHSVPGLRLFMRHDMDGEARLDHGGFTNATAVPVDIGADEFVYRIQFPTNSDSYYVPNPDGTFTRVTNLLSEVDEASGVAYLGTNATGPLIAVVDDEARTDCRIYQLDDSGTRVVATYPIAITNAAYPELADLEGLTFDGTNLYLITSQTKRNRYRDVDSSPPIGDPVADPPFNDYDYRRTALVRLTLGPQRTNATSLAIWSSESNGVPASVGHEPTYGLAAYLRARLTNNVVLRETNVGSWVLIATNSVNKFGTPVNGRAFPAGTTLPYANGGPASVAGASLTFLKHTTNSGTLTNAAAAAVTYYKIWAVDARTNYYPGPTVGVTNDGVPRLFINEFMAQPASGDDWIEFYNPAPITIGMGGLRIADSGLNWYTIPPGTNILARGFRRFFANDFTNGLNLPFKLGTNNDRVVLQTADQRVIDDYSFADQEHNVSEGRAWDGGPSGCAGFGQNRKGAKFRPGSSYPPTEQASNDTNRHRLFTVTPNPNFAIHYLAWQDLGLMPGVWRYSPKQHDFHPINIEDIAYRSTSEMVLGLRAPLTNRTTGLAYYFAVTNLPAFLSGGSWPVGTNLPGITGPYQMNLEGLGIRSLKWCPHGLTNASGEEVARYLILAGSANGGPLQREDFRQKFSLYGWTGNTNTPPVKLIDDLWPYTIRPEGVDLIKVAGEWRILFVEDRFQATAYATRNAVHWPVTILGQTP
jgi:predicted outer membrane repeat protein